MASRRQKPQPDLQVPVPTFPLSSPISEEISSPSCSSAEDREMERNRPFDFLVKSTRQKIEKSQKETPRSQDGSRLSIRGITKRKKSAKPVGLNLVTNFALEEPPKKKKSPRDEAAAPFVDLNDLKQLSKEREQERTAQKENTNTNTKVDWNGASKKRVSRSFQQLEDQSPSEHTRGSLLEPSSENPFSDRPEHGFSPSDRNVMIGLTVPYHESHNRSKEIDHTGDQQTPLTPSIIVTPAREEAPWSVDTSSPEGLRPRATSSVYSQPTPRLWYNESDVPPVPAIPQEHTSSKRQNVDSGFLNAHFAAMTRKRRSASANAVLDTQSPDTERPTSIVDDHEHEHEHDRRLLDRLSVNTDASRPQSQGWWNVLLSPLLGRSNTLSSKKSPISPGFPSSPSAAPSALGTNRHWWEKEKEKEKEISCFSPDTPETAVTNQWQDKMPGFEQSRSLDDTIAVPAVPDRQTAMSMMFPGNRIQGEAAEYYQACAHELFSKTSYFECFNHVCSLTPSTAAAACQPGVGAAVTGDRGLALIEPETQTDTADPQVKDAEVATVARGLLIDVDSPAEEAAKETTKKTGCAKCTHLRTSTSTVDSWASTTVDTVVGDNEKALPEVPKENTIEVIPEPPVQHATQQLPQEPVQPPVHEPAPVPAAYFPPDPPATAPAPAPAPYYPPEPPAPQPQPPMPAPAPYISPEPLTQAPPPQIINNNYHYGAPPLEIPPQAPVTVERATPHYVPVYPSNNPFFPPPPPQEQKQAEEADLVKVPPVPQAYSQEPPQEADITKVPAEFQDAPHGSAPQESDRSLAHLAPPGNQGTHQAPEPISPGFQNAAGGPGSISLSEVNAPAPTYAQHTRDIPLPQRYDYYPGQGAAVMNPTGEFGPGETQRRRLEREDAVGRKVGGLWRGRGCFSKAGCFGRPGREGRLRRRWYFGIGTLFLIIIIVAIALATTLTKKSDSTPVQSAWVNLTNYPPIQTGIMTIAGTEPQAQSSGCVSIQTLWSCALPKGTQQSENSPYDADQPTFRVEIRYRNGTLSNSTESGTYNANSTTTKRDVWSADPSPPSIADQTFLGNTTDNNSQPYAGEDTPFYLSVLSAVHLSSTNVYRRSTSNSSNSTSVIPAPTEGSDGTAAAATLYPLPSSQPIRLYNRGESSEHYGFYTYFDKSIFLKSRAPLNNSVTDYASEDKNGGSTKEDAQARCTWSQTRFLVQIWTNPSKTGYSLLSSGSGGSSTATATATSTSTSTSSTATSSSSATDYTTPGSFPYPVTITVDRHGGDQDKKRVYCWGVEESGHYNFTESRLQIEDLGVGGTVINEYGEDEGYGGIDGGTGGCKCSWINWISTS